MTGPSGSSATPKEIAEWMHEQLGTGELYQSELADKIIKTFGKQNTYTNANGNPAINKEILKEFNKLTQEDVVWSRSGQYWRKRKESDPPGKRMVTY